MLSVEVLRASEKPGFRPVAVARLRESRPSRREGSVRVHCTPVGLWSRFSSVSVSSRHIISPELPFLLWEMGLGVPVQVG